MTIMEAITQVDTLKPNTYAHDMKVQWLSRLDGMVKRLIIDTHEGWEKVAFEGYDKDTPTGTVLLVPEPFEEIYLRYLEMQIDYHSREIDSYNNSAARFNDAWTEYRNEYNRNHMPIGQRMRYF